MRISDWSSDVCSSDLHDGSSRQSIGETGNSYSREGRSAAAHADAEKAEEGSDALRRQRESPPLLRSICRSEETTSELQSLLRTSYAVSCLKKTNRHTHRHSNLTS